ncbi:helix-turn-helix domain-containing protein [Kerstersia gyiorum]|uniref:helix-turn-helix domain-containing protein n=1 Tax=Kerstersia gyiorum TaxID=206506 RepID=UPI0020A028F6|nr:helix-turn-helix domain-containing protein [Kerstersia gyiorum]MCP1634310.1 hypothetical protein [Kerstersia gyiorum]MCP1638063.1 hypothetical protein [Kerstersia gyiorum]MCP1672497.1 hypothetical protein [Kerstersia gyiorum]MCP1680113.1 hypothetical protein [Kerstersia gyiorum]MCP1683537.1 hypothetical protein [Kerstersia gyiorum]
MAHRVREGGLLMLPGDAAWAGAWRDALGDTDARLLVRDIDLLQVFGAMDAAEAAMAQPGDTGGDSLAAQALGRLGPVLRRFDFCILPVQRASLRRARLMLAWRRHAGASVPLLGLLDGLTAPAIRDLLLLGMDDFVLGDANADEVLARAARFPAAARNRDERSGGVAGAPAGLPAEVRTGLPAAGMPLLALCGISHAEVPFQEAKRQVLGQFEQEYLNVALRDAGGNVAAAARAVNKHRRAFWSLMRKHGFDARRYRPAPGEAVS